MQELANGIRAEVLADPQQAADVAAACVRLLALPPERFSRIKEEPWYRLMWHQMGGERLEMLGVACAHVAAARTLVLQLVLASARRGPPGLALLEQVLERLERQRAASGPLAEAAEAILFELTKVRRQLRYHAGLVDGEHDLPEEVAVALVRSMIAGGWINGDLCPAAQDLIERKIEDLSLSARSRRLLRTEIVARPSLSGQLASITNPKVRRLLYRNVAAVIMADGEIAARESRFLATLSRELGIPQAERVAIDESLYRRVMMGGVASLVGAITGDEEPRDRLGQADLEPSLPTVS